MKKNKNLLFIIFMCTVVSLVYLNHFENGFYYDDIHTVNNNLNIRDLNNIPNFFVDGKTFSSLPLSQSYRPLVTTSLAVDYWIAGGLDVFYFHLSSFIWFIGFGILLFFFLKHIFKLYLPSQKSYYLASFATLFFMVHPVQAETVNYIIARSEIQSTFFVLLGFVMYQSSALSRKYYLYLLPAFLSILAKEPGIMFIPLLMCYVWLFEYKGSIIDVFKSKKIKQLITFLKRMSIPIIVCMGLLFFAKAMIPKGFEPNGASIFNYLITQLWVFCYYIGSLFLPLGLNLETDLKVFNDIWNIKFFVGLIVNLVLITVTIITSKTKKYKPVSFGILWFYLSLLPTSSIIPLLDVKNDHRMFFPFVGLIIALVWPIFLWLDTFKLNKKSRTVLTSFCLVLLSAYAYGTIQRIKVWKSKETLWLDVVKKSPNNAKALVNCGMYEMDKGNFDKSEVYYKQAMEIAPKYTLLYVNYGRLKQLQNNTEQAERYLKKAIDLLPGYHAGWYFYGTFLMDQNRDSEAIVYLEKAISISEFIEGKYKLLEGYKKIKDWYKLKNLANRILLSDSSDKLAKAYLDYVSIEISKIDLSESPNLENPSSKNLLDLSVQFYNNKEYDKSIFAAKKLIELDSNSYLGYNNICACQIQLKNYDQAKTNCEKALEFKPDFKIALNNLKNIAKITDVPLAIDIQEKLLKVEPTEANYLQLSFDYYRLKMYDKCIEISNNGLKKHPNSFGLYNNICISYTALKNYELADIACKKGLQLKPDNKILIKNYKKVDSLGSN